MLDAITEHHKYGRSGLGAHPDTLVRKGWSAEEKAPLLAEALAYQANLTKAGTERKKKVGA